MAAVAAAICRRSVPRRPDSTPRLSETAGAGRTARSCGWWVRARPCRAAAQKRLPGGGGFGGEESGQRGGAKRREAKKQWEFVPRPGLDETGSSLDPDEEFWRNPLRSWDEFFATPNMNVPPSTRAWLQRLRLNLNFYSTNYFVASSCVTLALSLPRANIFLGIFLSMLAGVVASSFWVSTIGRAIGSRTGLDIAMFSNAQGGDRQLIVMAGSVAGQGGNSFVSVSEKKIVFQQSVAVVCAVLSVWATFLLLLTPVRSLLTVFGSALLSSFLNTIHASLLRPNLGSSFAGLGTVQSRSELKQNIETIWGVVTGRKDQS